MEPQRGLVHGQLNKRVMVEPRPVRIVGPLDLAIELMVALLQPRLLLELGQPDLNIDLGLEMKQLVRDLDLKLPDMDLLKKPLPLFFVVPPPGI